MADNTSTDRAAAARAVLARRVQERRAEWLRARGWTCVPPRDGELIADPEAPIDLHPVRHEFGG